MVVFSMCFRLEFFSHYLQLTTIKSSLEISLFYDQLKVELESGRCQFGLWIGVLLSFFLKCSTVSSQRLN